MKIFKCDHCGKEIQPYETELEVMIGKSYDQNWCRKIDLCNDCLGKVKEQIDLILFKENSEATDENRERNN